MKFYPVVDYIPRVQRQQLGFGIGDGYIQPSTSLGIPASKVHAVLTGEKRCPKKGEWYISGAIPEAYMAPNDLSTVFHIARLVRTITKTETRIMVDKNWESQKK